MSEQRESIAPDRASPPLDAADGSAFSSWKVSARVLATILALNFLANFVHFPDFGIYEDDYFFTLPPANWSTQQAWQNISYAVQNWPQGRPGWWVIHPTLAWLCGLTGSMAAHYLVLLFASSFCAFLVFRLLSRFVALIPAMAAALFFALYPADASKPIFMHLTNYYIGFMVACAGLSLYLSRYRAVSYPIAAVTLLIYEPYFLYFFLFPLVSFLVERRIAWRRWCAHWAVLVAVFAAVLFTRRQMGEPRAADLLANLGEFLARALLAPLLGGWTAIKLAFVRPAEALVYGPPVVWAVSALAAVLLGFVVVTLRSLSTSDEHTARCPPESVSRRWLAVVGVVFFMVPYVYRWHEDYYPPIVTLGRLSALHFPGALGAAMVVAAALSALDRLPTFWRRCAAWSATAYLCLLVGVGYHLQRVEYVEFARQQRDHWTRVVELSADLGDGDAIVVDARVDLAKPPDPRPSTQGFPAFWIVSYSPHFMPEMFHKPQGWTALPRVFGVWAGTRAERLESGVRLRTPDWEAPDLWPVLKDGKFILLRFEGLKLVRSESPLVVQGESVMPKPQGEPTVKLTRRPAHGLLFPASDLEWDSIRHGRNYPNQK